jgi:hypothetical protein
MIAETVSLALSPEEAALIEKRRAKLKKRRVSRVNQLRNSLRACEEWIANMAESGDAGFLESDSIPEIIESRRVLALTAPRKRVKKPKVAQAKPTADTEPKGAL